MEYIYSVYRNKICYVNSDNKLVLSHYNGGDRIIINSDADFVNSIADIILIDKYIILHTVTDDVHYHDIEINKLFFLVNRPIIKIMCSYEHDFECVDVGDREEIMGVYFYRILIASDTRVTRFINFRLAKEFIMPPDNYIVNFFSINDNYAAISLEKTFILEYNLNIITTLEQPYASIVRFNCDYYCLLAHGNIDVYDTNWIFTQTIKFKKIISICNHNNILAIVDKEKNYYHVVFGNSNTIGDPLDLVYSDNNLHIVITSNKKYLSYMYEYFKLREYIIFNDRLSIIDKYDDRSGKTINCDYNFSNTNIFNLVDKSVFMSIDASGTIQSHNIRIYDSYADINTSICNYEIKLKKTNNTKSAKQYCGDNCINLY
jgi:hypothetical protein